MKCPTRGCEELTLSVGLATALKKAGTGFESDCLVALVHGFRYDPETGARLPSFVSKQEIDADPHHLPEETTIKIPNCMKISKVINDDSDGEGDSAMPLSGCEIRFNPFTGRRISVADKKVLKTRGIYTHGGCGAATRPGSVASIRGRQPASAATIEAIKKE